jgi:carbonic anhydrase
MYLVKKYCVRLLALAKPLSMRIATIVLVLSCLLPLPAVAKVIAPQWSYEGATNPTRWGKITRDFATCELGAAQSPIDIRATVKGQPMQIAFNYKSSPLTLTNNGHSIQVTPAPGSTISIDNNDYALLQFHFHTPSEHQIAGKVAPMELHFVHRNAAGKLAVVGVMIDEGTEHPSIAQIWKAIPPTGQTTTISNSSINASQLLPPSKSYYTYAGSLTTPPCSEGVNWYILTAPITVSSAQIRDFAKLYPVNARPLQPTHTRRIELHGTI